MAASRSFTIMPMTMVGGRYLITLWRETERMNFQFFSPTDRSRVAVHTPSPFFDHDHAEGNL